MKTSTLQLMRLVSPALPIGSFAYSQGLETAVFNHWVFDETSAAAWIGGILKHSLGRLDLPVLALMHAAWEGNDIHEVENQSLWLLANRETFELRQEDRLTGGALNRLLRDLGLKQAGEWQEPQSLSLASMFSLAAVHWTINVDDCLGAYAWAWLENQVAAAIKLVPLGQTAGQRIIDELVIHIPRLVDEAMVLPWSAVGGSMPGLALTSANHESQYTRLFRS